MFLCLCTMMRGALFISIKAVHEFRAASLLLIAAASHTLTFAVVTAAYHCTMSAPNINHPTVAGAINECLYMVYIYIHDSKY
jgi:hypothetical protein